MAPTVGTGATAIVCPEAGARFYLEPVVDKRGNADPGDVGFTQTGMFNTLTTLHTRPAPAALMNSMFASFLERCDMASQQRQDADYVISASLITLQVSEMTGAFVESISVDVACEVTVRESSSGKLVERTIVDADAARDGLDTTGYATEVIETAYHEILGRFWQVLKCCPGGPK